MSVFSKVLNSSKRGTYNLSITYNTEQGYLSGKNIAITGATSGIGYAIAKRATELGANVLAIGRSKEKLAKVEGELKCKTLEWDVTDANAALEKVGEILKAFDGNLDCLVNNAGIYDESDLLNTSVEAFEKTINTNLKAGYFISKEVIKQCFLPKDTGNIVFISSNRGLMGDDCVYGISKAGVINFVKGLAKKYLMNNIRVNSIAPGMTGSNINGITDEDDHYNHGLKGKRVLSAKEIAEVAMFLISDASACMTGQTLECDNGESVL